MSKLPSLIVILRFTSLGGLATPKQVKIVKILSVTRQRLVRLVKYSPLSRMHGGIEVTKMLDIPGGRPRMLGPTTTTKLAQRMLHSSRVIADILPAGFYGSPGLNILLALHLAEENAQYPTANEMYPPGSASPVVTQRWIKALVSYGLVEQHNDLLALSSKGHETVIQLMERVFAVQRMLD